MGNHRKNNARMYPRTFTHTHLHAHTHTNSKHGHSPSWDIWWWTGWMDEWLGGCQISHTHINTDTNVMQSCWEWWLALHISISSHRLRSLSTELALMYKLSFPLTLSVLSHNNVDDYHPRDRERVHECVCLCQAYLLVHVNCMCVSLYLSVQLYLCVFWVKIVARLRCHSLIAVAEVWQHQRLTKPGGWESLLSLFIIVLVNSFITFGLKYV